MDSQNSRSGPNSARNNRRVRTAVVWSVSAFLLLGVAVILWHNADRILINFAAGQPSLSPRSTPSLSGTSAETSTVTSSTKNWETYTDDLYGFQLRYPQGWIRSIHGPSLVLSAPDPANDYDVPTILISALEGYEGQKVEDIYNGEILYKIDFKNDCRKIVFAGSAGYDCGTGSYFGRDAIFFYRNDLPFVIDDNVSNGISRRIISTFVFPSE